jgi:hypothetical protein
VNFGGIELLTVYNRVKVQVNLQVDKSSVVIKGPFFPRVMNPRYRICETNVISDMKVGMSDLKIARNETRLELADHRGQLNDIMAEIGYRKKHKKNQGFCMQGTILAVVVLIIGLVLGSYITAGLSKKFE